MTHHCTGETPYPGQFVFTCTDCSYRIVLTTEGRTVIDRGDPTANHRGSIGPIEMDVEMTS